MKRPPIPRPKFGGVIGSALLVAVVGFGMSGCFVGERPTLADEPTTGSAAVDAVIERVRALGEAVYTADYDVVPTFTGVTTLARASQSGPSRRSLTIGDVRYLVEGTDTRTCTVSTGDCVDVIDAARVSDVQMSPDFFGTSLVSRLRHDAETASGEPTASTEAALDQTATCVAIPVEASVINTYCVLDNGVLTRLVGGDLTVTLTAYEPGADASLFSEGD
jgi:hypothetical protein